MKKLHTFEQMLSLVEKCAEDKSLIGKEFYDYSENMFMRTLVREYERCKRIEAAFPMWFEK